MTYTMKDGRENARALDDPRQRNGFSPYKRSPSRRTLVMGPGEIPDRPRGQAHCHVLEVRDVLVG